MPPANARALPFAFVCSLLLHALLIGADWPSPPSPPVSPPPPLRAELLPPPPQPPTPPAPELRLDAPEEIEVAPASPPSPPSPPPRVPAPVARPQSEPVPRGVLPPAAARVAGRQLERLLHQEGFYPLEAVEQRLEGETWLRIFLDADGNVIAARTEQSSGHPLLDRAAERAARALRALPADGLGDALIRVRFRLEE